MGNLVTKEEALEALQRIFNNCEEIDNHLPKEERSGYKMYPDYNVVWLYLTAPEKQGKWVYRNIGGWHCSLCDEQAPFWCMASGQNLSAYCPNCGALMESEE